MRRDIIKDVQIKEPPIEELTRRYSTFSSIKRGCCGGCGCLLLLIILLALVFKFALGTGPKEITKLPTDFPADISIYDKDSIESITYISGKYKNRVIEISAIFPKIILTPLISVLEKDTVSNEQSKTTAFKNMWKIINSPISDRRDVIKVRWGNLNTDAAFVYSYYKTELEKANYTIDAQSDNSADKQFSFSKNDTAGSFYVKTKADGIGIELANLIINYYPQNTPTSTSNISN